MNNKTPAELITDWEEYRELYNIDMALIFMLLENGDRMAELIPEIKELKYVREYYLTK